MLRLWYYSTQPCGEVSIGLWGAQKAISTDLRRVESRSVYENFFVMINITAFNHKDIP